MDGPLDEGLYAYPVRTSTSVNFLSLSLPPLLLYALHLAVFPADFFADFPDFQYGTDPECSYLLMLLTYSADLLTPLC